MSVFKGLKPEALWQYFEEICRIPRLSGNEGKIRQYLLEFAEHHNLEAKEDHAGNVLITRPSHPDHLNRKIVVLQSHLDMVGEKTAGHPHDWTKDPVIPLSDGEWIRAGGTTLGADDGIGIAAQMAVLTDKTLRAGTIECLFTVDEESGMSGAKELTEDFFRGRILLNLDSEDEGILFIGSAGGMDTVGTMRYTREAVPPGYVGLEISLSGLQGGHSGDEIHKGLGNSVKIMTAILTELDREHGIRLSKFDGGNLRNAIPREAYAVILCRKSGSENIISHLKTIETGLRKKFGDLERNLKLEAAECTMPSHVMDRGSQDGLLRALSCCPHGVIAWSEDMKDLVETSSNLASVKFEPAGFVTIVSSQRSSFEASKAEASAMVEDCLKQAGATVTKSAGYPGWAPNINSEILGITRQAYRRLFGKDPEVKAIHAGLECGLIYEKFRKMDMISFGPTIRGAHTPDEKIEIRTVPMFWNLLMEVINNIPLKSGYSI